MSSVLQHHKADINCLSLIPEQRNGYVCSLLQRENELVSCDCSGEVAFWRSDDVLSFVLLLIIVSLEFISNRFARRIDW